MRRPHFLIAALVLGLAGLVVVALDAGTATSDALEPAVAQESPAARDGRALAAPALASRGAAAATSEPESKPVEVTDGESSRTALDASPTPDAPEAAGPPVVHLRVVREDAVAGDVPVAGLRVVSTRSEGFGPEEGVHVGTTDGEGRLVAELERAGVHVFHPEPASLPPEVLAPSELSMNRFRGSDAENGAHEFAPGETATLTLRLPSAGTLTVRVRNADGTPATGVGVEVWARRESERPSHVWIRPNGSGRSWTDADGLAVFDRLPAGELSVNLNDLAAPGANSGLLRGPSRPGPPAAEKLETAEAVRLSIAGEAPPARPAPKRVTLPPGGREHVALALGAGTRALRARVVDASGAPIAGVSVTAHYDRRDAGVPAPERRGSVRPSMLAANALTDQEGRFAIESLEEGPYLLYFSTWALLHDAGGSQLAPLRDVLVEVPATGGSGPVDLGDVVVPRPEVFRVRGRVVLTRERLGKRQLRLSRVRPTIGGEVAERRERNRPYAGCTFDSRTGEFEAACRLPLETLVLRLGERLGEEHVREYEFVPEAGVVLEDVELRYP